MPRITLALEPELLDLLKLHKPKRQSLSAFCADLIEQKTLGLASPLDRGTKLPAYCVGAGTHHTVTAVDSELGRSEAEASSAESTAVDGLLAIEDFDQGLEPKKKGGVGGKKIDPFARRALDLDLIPEDLLDCQQLLPEFWACKKGTRSQAVFTRVCNKLRQWDPDQRREALERAIASGWGDVFEPPSVKAANAVNTGYVDSITRDRIEREKFLAMFSNPQEVA